jgi:hypothetical protein
MVGFAFLAAVILFQTNGLLAVPAMFVLQQFFRHLSASEQ